MGNGSSNEQPNRAPRGPSISGWPGGGGALEASGSGTNSRSASNVGANTAGLNGDSGSGAAGSGVPGAATPRWMGKRIGRFRLMALLGQGAMGRVFRAEDTLMSRHVALKVLPRAFKRGGVRVGPEMLINEARAAAAIEHPNAVAIHEVNQAGDVCYVAMELLEGGNLRDLVRAAGPMDLPRACLMCAEAADALAAAHAVGVVHRDIKPANLMLSRSGRCKVVDFGLARLDEATKGGAWAENASPENVGTPQFIAPELLSGTPASAASDIYSLGATLFYLLTRRPPYQAKSARDLLRMHMEAPVPNLRSFRPDVSRALAEAVSKALAKRPAERWASMEQFARVLRVHAIPTAPESAAANLPTPAPQYLPPGAAIAKSPTLPGKSARPASPLRQPLPKAQLAHPIKSRMTRLHLGLPAWAWLAGGALVAAAVVVVCIAVAKAPSRDVATTGEPSSAAPVQIPTIQAPPPAHPASVQSPVGSVQISAPLQPQASATRASGAADTLPHVPVPSPQMGLFEAACDIGNVKIPGVAIFDAARHDYTVTGDGFDIYYENDSCHFVWRKMSGDLTIKSAVRFVAKSPARFRKAALIVRQSLDPNSPFADMVLHGDGTIGIQERLTAGGDAEQHMTRMTGTTLWLVRHGDRFVGYVSSPGTEPQPTVEVTLPMKDPVYVGLAVTARDGPERPAPKPETAVFSDVEITPAALLTGQPAPR